MSKEKIKLQNHNSESIKKLLNSVKTEDSQPNLDSILDEIHNIETSDKDKDKNKKKKED
ncbi:MAG: hypothetical protein PHY08_08955 [Candidatus Cloacimonetes bacterium]|jgi:hypothetical protein|nr:hypothetical protein [Candidatus Cloacimonadota bacterium]MDD4156685.1 hypothetical protein [Candidatus Cloacimonadota bacterium]